MALDGLLIFGTAGDVGGGADCIRFGRVGNGKGGGGPHTMLLRRAAASSMKGITLSLAVLSLMKQARRMR